MSVAPTRSFTRARRCIVPAVLAPLALSHAAHGQAAAPAAWGLYSARFDTRTSDFIYAVYGYGDVFGMVAVLHNPRSNYSEVLGAMGRNFRIAGGPTQSVALGVSRATEAWYAQLYYLPAVHDGRLWMRATTELYLPLERAGTVQFAFSPLAATVGVGHAVEVGLATDLSAAQRATPSTALGPELRVSLPKAVIGTDLQRFVDGSGGRFRLFFLTSF
jgi:hypothetical protein